ncbi:MAG: ATP-binding protein [Bacteroidales bacterium]|nr:ATP-binding protein [Bacteroidales bacterium]
MRNDTADIMLMAEFIDGLCEKYQLPMDVGFSLNLALEEAVANVMKYAYPEGEVHDIVLSVKLTDNRLMFKLIDTGKPFDPTIVPDADVNLSAEERQIGGLGIFLVRQIMDSVEYRRIDGKNILTMIKLL